MSLWLKLNHYLTSIVSRKRTKPECGFDFRIQLKLMKCCIATGLVFSSENFLRSPLYSPKIPKKFINKRTKTAIICIVSREVIFFNRSHDFFSSFFHNTSHQEIYDKLVAFLILKLHAALYIVRGLKYFNEGTIWLSRRTKCAIIIDSASLKCEHNFLSIISNIPPTSCSVVLEQPLVLFRISIEQSRTEKQLKSVECGNSRLFSGNYNAFSCAFLLIGYNV